MIKNRFVPEGMLINTPENLDTLSSIQGLEKAMAEGDKNVYFVNGEQIQLVLALQNGRVSVPQEHVEQET